MRLDSNGYKQLTLTNAFSASSDSILEKINFILFKPKYVSLYFGLFKNIYKIARCENIGAFVVLSVE